MVERTALAPAKVNLFLHVGPIDTEGYHPLASLAAFADVGDLVTVRRAERLSLTVSGSFAGGLDGDDDNLILRALRALGEAAGTGEPSLAVHLEKRLPIAAGLGGGSSDAGAALKLARDVLGLTFDDEALAKVAGTVGADGPMCLFAEAAWAEGRGDVLTLEPRLPALPTVLVNPGAACSTAAVYRAYDKGLLCVADRPAGPPDWTLATVLDWLTAQRNDLQPPAIESVPIIGDVIESLREQPKARLVRMSGSGATVFGLFETMADAATAAEAIRSAHPDWWVQPTALT